MATAVRLLEHTQQGLHPFTRNAERYLYDASQAFNYSTYPVSR